MDTSSFVDVSDESFGRFWKILQLDHGLKQLDGKGLVDYYYSLNPKVHVKKEGKYGEDYFTREEVIQQLNLPHNKARFIEAFQLFTEYIRERSSKDANTGAKSRRERKKQLHAPEYHRSTEQQPNPCVSESESDTDVYTDNEEHQSEAQVQGGANYVKSSKRRRVEDRSVSVSVSEVPDVSPYSFVQFWGIVSKARNLRTFEGGLNCKVVYGVIPGSDDKALALSRRRAMIYFNENKAKFAAEFKRFKEFKKEMRRRQGCKRSKTSTSQVPIARSSTQRQRKTKIERQTPKPLKEGFVEKQRETQRGNEEELAEKNGLMREKVSRMGSSEASSTSDSVNHLSAAAEQTDKNVQAFVQEVSQLQQRRITEIKKKRQTLSEEITRLQERVDSAKAQRAALRIEELKLRAAKFVIG